MTTKIIAKLNEIGGNYLVGALAKAEDKSGIEFEILADTNLHPEVRKEAAGYIADDIKWLLNNGWPFKLYFKECKL